MTLPECARMLCELEDILNKPNQTGNDLYHEQLTFIQKGQSAVSILNEMTYCASSKVIMNSEVMH